MAYSSHHYQTVPYQDYLQSLFVKALAFCNSDWKEDVNELYRCKPEAYFDAILDADGIIRPVLKDNGGDPKCPINGRLAGVFFGVTLFNGGIPTMSPFGDRMVLVPLHEVFTENCNLYFADFYCMSVSQNHYVCLVLTEKLSAADTFCQQNLIALDVSTNIFLKRQVIPTYNEFGLRTNNISYSTIQKAGLYLEIFYTKDVDIKGKTIIEVGTLGQGHSTPGGIPKNPYCSQCNV